MGKDSESVEKETYPSRDSSVHFTGKFSGPFSAQTESLTTTVPVRVRVRVEQAAVAEHHSNRRLSIRSAPRDRRHESSGMTRIGTGQGISRDSLRAPGRPGGESESRLFSQLDRGNRPTPVEPYGC